MEVSSTKFRAGEKNAMRCRFSTKERAEKADYRGLGPLSPPAAGRAFGGVVDEG
jgi:hypothetical protein